MPVTCAAGARIPLRPDEPWAGLLATIAAEVTLGDDGPLIRGVRVPVPPSAGDLAALTAVLHARYFLGSRAGHDRRRTGRAVVVGAHGSGPAAGPRSRCYLHLRPARASVVLARLVADLDAKGLPFTAGLLLTTADRPDAATVCAARARIDVVADLVLRRAPGAVAAPVPAFTLALAPGVAIADDPDDGSDFGMHRCRAVAAGLLAAGPAATAGSRLAAVRWSLSASGVDPRSPHRATRRSEPGGVTRRGQRTGEDAD